MRKDSNILTLNRVCISVIQWKSLDLLVLLNTCPKPGPGDTEVRAPTVELMVQ